MRQELEPKEEQHSRWPKSLVKFGAAAMSTLALAGIAGNQLVDSIDGRSGEIINASEQINPIVYTDPLYASAGEEEFLSPENDGELRIVSWNLANQVNGSGSTFEQKRLEQIADIIGARQLDALLFQEITERGALVLAREFPDYTVYYVIGEDMVRPDKPNFGNVIMSYQTPDSVTGVSLRGTPKIASLFNAAVGGIGDIFSRDTGDWPRFRDAWSENRAIIVSDFNAVSIGDSDYPVSIATTHTSYQDTDIGERQLSESKDVMNARSGEIIVLCGDLNRNADQVAQRFEGYTVMPSGPTTVWGATLDYCLHNELPPGLSASLEVLPDLRTDHHALFLTLAPTPTLDPLKGHTE